jgi:hypothetical protein
MRRDDVLMMQGDDRVAPIFRLLGEGRLTSAEVEALTASLVAAGLPDVPEAWLARARTIGQRSGRAGLLSMPAGRAGGTRVLTATLMGEQRPWLAVAGVRGSVTDLCRLLFAVDAYEIVVQGRSRRHQPCHDLTGQVLRDGEPVPSAAIVLAGPGGPSETEADDEGSFRFGAVAEGRYDLEVWAEDDLIVCTPVVLGASRG